VANSGPQDSQCHPASNLQPSICENQRKPVLSLVEGSAAKPFGAAGPPRTGKPLST
jgi:hypothetical protein